MNKKEWRSVEITEQAARRALAVAGVTDNAKNWQVERVTAAKHRTLGSITVRVPVDIRPLAMEWRARRKLGNKRLNTKPAIVAPL